MDPTHSYLRPDDTTVQEALYQTARLAVWFDRYDPSYQGHPNIRISRTIVCICIGDEVIWNSKDNTIEQLDFTWIMGEYRRVLKERYEPVEAWFNDQTTFTGDQT